VSLHIAKECDAWVDWRAEKRTAALVIESFTRGVEREAEGSSGSPRAPRRSEK
jgi:hypothetical protein